MTRMRAPFSSFSLWLSDFSSVKICRETKTRWDQRGSGARGDIASPPPSTLPWLCSISRAFRSWLPGVMGERDLEHSTAAGSPEPGSPWCKARPQPQQQVRTRTARQEPFLSCFIPNLCPEAKYSSADNNKAVFPDRLFPFCQDWKGNQSSGIFILDCTLPNA